MKHILFLVFFIGLLSKVDAQQLSSTSKSITIEECYQMAKENYPSYVKYLLAKERVKQSNQNLDRGYLPQITLSAKASFQSHVTSLPISLPGVSISTPDRDQYGVTADLNQVIWDGGVISSGKRLNNAQYDIDMLTTDVEVYRLNERVNSLVFAIRRLNVSIDQSDIYCNDLSVTREKISNLVESGVAGVADLNVIEAELLSVQGRKRSLIMEREALQEQLSLMLDTDMSGISVEIPIVGDVAISSFPERAELSLFEKQQEKVDGMRDVVNSKKMPRIGIFIQSGYSKPGLNMLSNEFTGYMLGGVRLTWNLSSLYTTKGEHNLLKISQREIESQKSLFEYNLNLAVKKKLRDIDRLKELIKEDEKIVKLRDEVAIIAQRKLEGGIYGVHDLIEDISRLDAARVSLESRKLELVIAKYEYKFLLNN